MILLENLAETLTREYGVTCGCCDNDPAFYHAELRQLCESNACGMFGRCHTCPPGVGTPEECIQKPLAFSRVLVFQKVYPLEDSFDFEGMMRAKDEFRTVCIAAAELTEQIPEAHLFLGAGGCGICETCAAAEGKPCRFPDRAIASLESHCIGVSELAARVGMKYINGQNTVTYFGAVFC